MADYIKIGRRLRWRQAVEADVDYIMEAENRAENVDFIMPDTRELHLSTLRTADLCHIIIEEIETGETIGYLMIAGLANPSNEIEWRRIVIDKKGQGYGHETLAMLEAWSFDDLKMHRGWLDAKDYNARALHVYETAGLKREALLRETVLHNGVYENLVILGILDREYYELKEKGAIPTCD